MAASLRAVWTSTSTLADRSCRDVLNPPSDNNRFSPSADRTHTKALLEVQSAKIHRDTRADRYGTLNSKGGRYLLSGLDSRLRGNDKWVKTAFHVNSKGGRYSPVFKSKSPEESVSRFGDVQGAFNSNSGSAFYSQPGLDDNSQPASALATLSTVVDRPLCKDVHKCLPIRQNWRHVYKCPPDRPLIHSLSTVLPLPLSAGRHGFKKNIDHLSPYTQCLLLRLV